MIFPAYTYHGRKCRGAGLQGDLSNIGKSPSPLIVTGMFKARRVYMNWLQLGNFRPSHGVKIHKCNTFPSMPVHNLVDQLLMVDLEKGFD